MTTVSALAILRASAALAGEVIRPDMGNEFAPDADTLARFTARLNERLPAIWGAANWPDVVDVDMRRQVGFAVNTFSHYAIFTEVWAAETNRCYRAMVEQADGAKVTDVGQWAPLLAEYPVTRFDRTRTYVPGDIVHFALPEVMQYYTAANTFVLLAPFDPSFAFVQSWEKSDMGDVLLVTERDPRLYECPGVIPYTPNGDGVRVAGDPGSAWFTYRLPCPLVTGAPFDATRAYFKGDQVFWVSGTQGDYYDLLQGTQPGETPVTYPFKFRLVKLPKRFAQWLSAVVSADWLRWDRQQEKALDREAAALRELDRLLINLGRDQRQTGQLAVRSPAYLP